MDLNRDLRQHIILIKNITVNTITYDIWLFILLAKVMHMHEANVDIDEDLLWVDCHIYYLYLAPQRSAKWLMVRKGRVTGSVAGYACNESEYDTNYNSTSSSSDSSMEGSSDSSSNNNSISLNELADLIANYDQYMVKNEVDLNQTADEILGYKAKQFSNFALKCMQHGTQVEPIIRIWHEKQIQGKVMELPLAVPKWCLYLGVSIDGYIFGSNGIAEYKAPQTMYVKLIQYMQKQHILQTQFANVKLNITYDHININHFIQMYIGMAVFQKQFCDYVVYDNVRRNQVFAQRVDWDQSKWDTIKLKLDHFIDHHLKPVLPANYPIMPHVAY